MGALWVTKGSRFLQEESFDGPFKGSLVSKVSSGRMF